MRSIRGIVFIPKTGRISFIMRQEKDPTLTARQRKRISPSPVRLSFPEKSGRAFSRTSRAGRSEKGEKHQQPEIPVLGCTYTGRMIDPSVRNIPSCHTKAVRILKRTVRILHQRKRVSEHRIKNDTAGICYTGKINIGRNKYGWMISYRGYCRMIQADMLAEPVLQAPL